MDTVWSKRTEEVVSTHNHLEGLGSMVATGNLWEAEVKTRCKTAQVSQVGEGAGLWYLGMKEEGT